MLAKLKDRRVYLILIFAVLLGYWGVWNGFFQQDEWAGLGFYFSALEPGLPASLANIYSPLFRAGLAHFLPGVPFLNFVRYSLFGLSYPPYAIFSLVLHFLASILVYELVYLFSKNKFLSLVASSFFVLSASASQAVTWVATSVPTQFGAIFALLSLLFWFRKRLFLSMALAVLAVLFKETALFLFLFLPVSAYITMPEKRKKIVSSTFVAAAAYSVLRFLVIANSKGVNSAVDSFIFLARAFFNNYFSVLLRGVAQTALPGSFLAFIPRKVAVYLPGAPPPDTHGFDVFFEASLFRPGLTIVGLALLLLMSFTAARNSKKYLQIFLLFIFSYAPLAFIPTGELTETLLASRNLYIPTAVLMIFLAIFLAEQKRARKKAFVLFALFLTLLQIFFLREKVEKLVGVGRLRKGILTEVKVLRPKLPDRVVIYTESDKAYYGLPPEENILPFQSGLGQTLLVWYHPSENFPAEFFSDNFLWEITDQGYREAEGRGFGYFRDFNELQKAIDSYNLSKKSVIAFSWKSETGQLLEITEEVRSKL